MRAWSERHTHHWDDWDLDALVATKGSRVVSLVVPARNEAATVGDVVAKVRAALVDTVALLDEIVVIDSDSTDDTYAVATDAGATVHRSAEIRPDLGSLPGKGEAMWKSLFVTAGEVVVFMDADLLDWDTHFVPGLLGPLLTDPGRGAGQGVLRAAAGVRRCRGAVRGWPGHRARRPSADRAALPRARRAAPAARGGVGRPALAASSELQVPHGYAVELAALVDTVRLRGLDAIAQVDLGTRAHRHQSLRDLGGMSTQILEAALARVGAVPQVDERPPARSVG